MGFAQKYKLAEICDKLNILYSGSYSFCMYRSNSFYEAQKQGGIVYSV